MLTNLRFYHAWMQVDSREVGMAYQDYIKQTQRFGRMHRHAAWTAPIIDSDEGMREELSYQYDNEPELTLCLMAMRRELYLWSFTLRRCTQKTLTQQRKAREELTKMAGEDLATDPILTMDRQPSAVLTRVFAARGAP